MKKNYKFLRLIKVCVILLLCFPAIAQKPPLKIDSYKDWKYFSEYGITDNGKYAWYIANSCIQLTSVSGELNWNFTNAWNKPQFSSDGKLAYVRNMHDSLAIIDLYRGNVD